MTSPLLEPEAATRPPRLGAVRGLALGLVAALALSWLMAEGTAQLSSAVRDQSNGEIALAGLWLLIGGVVLGLIGLGIRHHPLIPGVPALWFGVVFGQTLLGLGPPGWLPGFSSSFFLQAWSPAVYVIFGYLLVATVVATVRRRRRWLFK